MNGAPSLGWLPRPCYLASTVRWSELFIPTLRDDPSDAEVVSHRLMLRAGLIRQLGAGIYSKLPLARRVHRKIEAIMREELERIGAQEFQLPVLQPAELWKNSGRWESMGDILFRLRDRKRSDMCLAATHEEAFTSISRELRSYRQLPQIWFHFQTKCRDEARPKSGVLRSREFTMKDSYSFDVDFDGLDRSFDLHTEAYNRILERCGVPVMAVEASSGVMGGSESVEFMALSNAGEDWVVTCEGCGYAANLEKALSVPRPVEDPQESSPVEKFATPGVRTIEDLAAFKGGAPGERQIKTLVLVVRDELTLFLLRGDYELNDVKVAELCDTTDFRPAHPEECKEALGALPGSLGAVGVTELPVFADEALRDRRGMTTGANEDDFHLRNVDVARDLGQVRWLTCAARRKATPARAVGSPCGWRRPSRSAISSSSACAIRREWGPACWGRTAKRSRSSWARTAWESSASWPLLSNPTTTRTAFAGRCRSHRMRWSLPRSGSETRSRQGERRRSTRSCARPGSRYCSTIATSAPE